MPKVKINNTQGLVQASGGGIALFGATETVVPTGGGAQIAETTSLALCPSTADAHIIKLPAITNLDTGHTILIVNTSATSKEFDLVVPTNTTRMNGVAGTPAKIDVKENAAVKCIYSGAANPGWVVVVGDMATLPA